MKEKRTCPKCKGDMEEGIIPDASGALSTRYPPKWVTKIKLITLKDESKNVKTFRCTSCGYLESYAE